MRIKKIQLNTTDISKLGLKEFSSTKFNSVIALVGKNGSGKSRYLKVIEEKIKNYNLQTDFNDFFDFSPEILTTGYKKYQQYKSVYDLNVELEHLALELQNNSARELKVKYNTLNTQLNSNPNNANILRQFKSTNQIIEDEIKKRIKVIKPTDLRRLQEGFDSQNGKVSFQNIIDSTIDTVDVNEFEMISESALSYLQRLPHKLVLDDFECKGDDKKFKNRIAYQRYKLLSTLIQDFLGKDLQWISKSSNVNEFDDHVMIKATGHWIVDDREFNYNDFSDGEKVLFTYAILLFLLNTNPRIKFKESIIIIDEPELNLHPKAQIKLIETLRTLIKDEGQLIIATHSISIISNLDYGSIFLVRDGELQSPSSSVPFKAIDDLMGFEEHYNKMVEFLVSTPAWAMTNFMAQCFEDPEVFQSASNNDPQLEIFKNLILLGNNLNILDFGSGKGRLLDRIKENGSTWNRIDNYDCFDINKDYNDIIISKGGSHIYNDLKEIPKKKYDLIVLVNVLHEIHIQHWEESLNKIKASIKPEGFLAIIEDTELPIGELPNELGFLLLEKEEMKMLLSKNTNFITPNSERYKERIICGLVGHREMNSITITKLISTLECLKMNALSHIISFRDNKENKLNVGRLYGLKANTYVNSQLAIDYLNNTKIAT